MYDPPDPRQLRFLSARPLHMAITTYSPTVNQLDELQQQAAALTQKVRQSLDVDPAPPVASCLDLDAVVQQVCLKRMEICATRLTLKIDKLGTRNQGDH